MNKLKRVAFMNFINLLLVFAILSSSCSEKKRTGPLPTKDVDEQTWTSYQTILDKFLIVKTHEGKYGSYTHNLFDYESFKNSSEAESLIKQQSDILKATKVPTDLTKALTFWINAYNYFTLVDVYNNYPVESMKDIGWKNEVHDIGGFLYSLDEIEHEIIRPMNEPRIHFSINCASISCPSLKSKVYTSDNLEKELTEQVQNSFKNPLHLKLVDSELHVTKLFDWFDDDFEIEKYGSIEGFIKAYAPVELHKTVEDYIDYNWKLNKP